MNPIIKPYLPKLNELFSKHHVIRAYAFGSILSDKFNTESDVDFVIDIDEKINPVELGEHLWTLQFELQDLFKRDVDLIASRSIRNPYFKKQVEQTRQLIYG